MARLGRSQPIRPYRASALANFSPDRYSDAYGDDYLPSSGVTLFSSLSDRFNTVDTGIWTGAGSLVSGRIRAQADGSYTWALNTIAQLSLTGNYVFAQVEAAPVGSDSSVETFLLLDAGSNNGLIFLRSGANLVFRVRTGGVDSDTSVTYDATAHAYWRVTENGGTVGFDTSPDGATWTSRRTASPSFGTGALTLAFGAGFFGSPGAGPFYAYIDNVNAADASPTAQPATATSTAAGPTPAASANPVPAAAQATSTAAQPTITATAGPAGQATATSAAAQPTVSATASPTASAASATSAAAGPTIATAAGPPAQAAQATSTVAQPTVITSANPTGQAAATSTAAAPSVSVGSNADPAAQAANAASTAASPTISASANPLPTGATAISTAAGPQITAGSNPTGQSTATSTAAAPTIRTTANPTASAAQATSTAASPTISLSPRPTGLAASATSTAAQPIIAATANPTGQATATSTAASPQVSTGISPIPTPAIAVSYAASGGDQLVDENGDVLVDENGDALAASDPLTITASANPTAQPASATSIAASAVASLPVSPTAQAATATSTAAGPTVAVAVENLTANASFEWDSDSDGRADGFSVFGSPTLSGQTGRGGVGRSQRMVATTTDTVELRQDVPIAAVAPHSFSVYANVTALAGAAKFVFKVEWRDAGNSFVGQDYVIVTDVGGGFIRRSFTSTPPATSVKARIVLALETGAGTVDLDDLQMEAGSTVSEYREPEIDWMVRSVMSTAVDGTDSDGAIARSPARDAIRPREAAYTAIGFASGYRRFGVQRFADAAWAWVAWHRDHMEPDGTVFDWDKVAGTWTKLSTREATDAYAGLFLVALAAAHSVDARSLTGYATAVDAAVDAIELTLDTDDLTFALPTTSSKYLTNQVEAAAGLHAAIGLANTLGDAALRERARLLRNRVLRGVSRLWDATTPTAAAYDWAKSDTGILDVADWAVLGDALQQAWAVAYGAPDVSRSSGLMTQFVASQPNWAKQAVTGRYDPFVSVALQRVSDDAAAQSGIADVLARAAIQNRAGNYGPMTAGLAMLVRWHASDLLPDLPDPGVDVQPAVAVSTAAGPAVAASDNPTAQAAPATSSAAGPALSATANPTAQPATATSTAAGPQVQAANNPIAQPAQAVSTAAAPTITATANPQAQAATATSTAAGPVVSLPVQAPTQPATATSTVASPTLTASAGPQPVPAQATSTAAGPVVLVGSQPVAQAAQATSTAAGPAIRTTANPAAQAAVATSTAASPQVSASGSSSPQALAATATSTAAAPAIRLDTTVTPAFAKAESVAAYPAVIARANPSVSPTTFKAVSSAASPTVKATSVAPAQPALAISTAAHPSVANNLVVTAQPAIAISTAAQPAAITYTGPGVPGTTRIVVDPSATVAAVLRSTTRAQLEPSDARQKVLV